MPKVPFDLLSEIMGMSPKMTREAWAKLPTHKREEILMQANSHLGDVSDMSLQYGEHPNGKRRQEIIEFLKSVGGW